MPPETVLTYGMAALVILGFAAGVGVMMWFVRQAGSLKREILTIVSEHEEKVDRRFAAVGDTVAALRGQVEALAGRIHATELALEVSRREIAETYMSKASAGEALKRVATMIEAVERRLADIETFLREGAGRRPARG